MIPLADAPIPGRDQPDEVVRNHVLHTRARVTVAIVGQLDRVGEQARATSRASANGDCESQRAPIRVSRPMTVHELRDETRTSQTSNGDPLSCARQPLIPFGSESHLARN